MKLPRWLLIGLWTTSVLAVLAAAGWWWVTWPERTAREFVDRLAIKDFEGAKRMWNLKAFDPENRWSHSYWVVGAGAPFREWSEQGLKFDSRTLSDTVRGRRGFRIPVYEGDFVAERGLIVAVSPFFDALPIPGVEMNP